MTPKAGATVFVVDRLALTSPGARFHPGEKALPALVGLGLSLASPRPVVAGGLLILFAGLGVLLSGARVRTYLAVLAAPAGFIAAGALGLAVGAATLPPAGSSAVDLGAFSLYWSAEGGRRALLLGLRSLAASSALIALALSTPMNDLLWLSGRLGVPSALVELASLTYRFIAILWETAERIRIAQDCRLGYRDLRTSIRSVSQAAAATFRLAWKRSESVWAALRSRGYEGSLRVASFRSSFRVVPPLLVSACLCAVWGLLTVGSRP